MGARMTGNHGAGELFAHKLSGLSVRHAWMGPSFFLWGWVLFHSSIPLGETEYLSTQRLVWLCYQIVFTLALLLSSVAGKRLYLLLTKRVFLVCATLFMSLGSAAIVISARSSQPWDCSIAIAGSVIASIGYAGLAMMWGVAYIRLPRRSALLSSCAGIALAALCFLAILNLNEFAGRLVAVVLPFVSIAAMPSPSQYDGAQLEIHAHKEEPKLHVLIMRIWFCASAVGILVGIIRGYGSLWNDGAFSPVTFFFFGAPAVIALLVFFFEDRLLPRSHMQLLMVLLALTGLVLLLAFLPSQISSRMISVLSSILWMLIEIIFWSTLAFPRTENRLGAFVVFCKKRASLQMGLILGGVIGMLLDGAHIPFDRYASIAYAVLTYAILVALIVLMFKVTEFNSFKNVRSKLAEDDMDAGCNPSGAFQPSSPVDEKPLHSPPENDQESVCAKAARAYRLTPREAEVLSLLASGRNAESIGKILVVSSETAKTHTKHIYSKMGVHSRQELLDKLDDFTS